MTRIAGMMAPVTRLDTLRRLPVNARACLATQIPQHPLDIRVAQYRPDHVRACRPQLGRQPIHVFNQFWLDMAPEPDRHA